MSPRSSDHPPNPQPQSQSRLLHHRMAGAFRVTHKQYSPSFRQGVHAHELGAIDFNVAGGGAGTYAGAAVDSVPGVIEFFAPGREHSFRAGPHGIRTMHVAFTPDVLADLHPVHDDPQGRHIDQATGVAIAMRLFRELADPDVSSPLAMESLCYQLLGTAVRWRDNPERDSAWLQWVRERLHEPGEVTLSELASLAGVHRAHLCRAFSAQYATTVGEYQRRVRLAATAAALAGTLDSIAAIAHDAGFADQAHFSRWFKRMYAMTPGSFRRTMHGERRALQLGFPQA